MKLCFDCQLDSSVIFSFISEVFSTSKMCFSLCRKWCGLFSFSIIFSAIVSKEAAEQKAIKRRQIEPFTCSNFPRVEHQTEPVRLMSEQALMEPITRPQIKTEIELVQLQQQIGDLLRKIPIVDMEDVLEDIFTIDVDDVEGYEYDDRFAALFGLSQSNFDLKTEPQEEQNDEVNPSCDIDNEPCTSVLARYGASSTTSPQMQPLENATAANEDKSGIVWYIDCDDEMSSHTYDEHFATYFGLPQNLPPYQVKQEDDVETFDEGGQTNDVPPVSIDPIANATSTADSITEKHPEQPIMGMSVHDPISQHYEFDVDVCI